MGIREERQYPSGLLTVVSGLHKKNLGLTYEKVEQNAYIPYLGIYLTCKKCLRSTEPLDLEETQTLL